MKLDGRPRKRCMFSQCRALIICRADAAGYDDRDTLCENCYMQIPGRRGSIADSILDMPRFLANVRVACMSRRYRRVAYDQICRLEAAFLRSRA